MFCRYCGKDLPNDSNFCPNCGAKQKEDVSENSGNSVQVPKFVNEHKNLIYAYIVWFLIHLSLLIFSNGSQKYYFYPFDDKFSDVISNFPFVNFSLLKYCDAYDFSEFFFYTILFPLIIYGIVKCYPYLSPLFKKIKGRLNQWDKDNAKSIKEYNANINAYTQSLNKEETFSKKEKDEIPTVVEQVEKNFEKTICQDNSEIVIPDEQSPDVKIQEEQPLTIEEVKKMPLFRRFISSIIDKVIILIIFVVGLIAISPYGAPGRLGKYIGLLNISPNNYEYIDRGAMNSYGTYSDGISQYYQDKERLANEPPHIGSTMELDMSITFSFIILNILYYIFFESIMSASLGKRLLGGVLFDSADERIGFVKAFGRCVCGGVFMSGVYFLLHLFIGLSNHVVVFVYFLLVDLPVFFTKRSLLDICTGTKYVDVLTKEDWKGKYGEPDILVKNKTRKSL